MNANTRRERNADGSDDELATVYERPTSQQAKDRLTNADSATLNGWDVTLDDEDELKHDDQSASESDSLDLDEDELKRAKEDVAYVDALLNGEDPDDEGVATDGGVDMRPPEDESDDNVEHFDDIESLDEANQAAIEQGMLIRIQPPAPKPTRYYFVDGSDWKRQTAGHKIATTVSVPRETVKSAIPKNKHAGGGGVKAVDPSKLSSLDLDRQEQNDENEPVTDGGVAQDEEARDIIDDQGAWAWALSVESDGTVRASKAIPYDGSRAFSTKDAAQSRSSRRRGSQFHLSVEQVVDRYHRHSQTDRSKADLLEDVKATRRAKSPSR